MTGSSQGEIRGCKANGDIGLVIEEAKERRNLKRYGGRV